MNVTTALTVSFTGLILFLLASLLVWGLAVVSLRSSRLVIQRPHQIKSEMEKPSLPAVVSAPYAGVVESLTISSGQSVDFGQALCVINTGAQKIAIRSAREGVLATICIAEGDSVQPGEPLMEFQT